MTSKQEKDLALRGKRAHERMHGASTWIEAHYEPINKQVRVTDHELGVVTRWHVLSGKRKIRFYKQIGERL